MLFQMWDTQRPLDNWHKVIQRHHDKVICVDDNCCAIQESKWRQLAQRMSLFYQGVWSPSKSGITARVGNRSYYLVDRDEIPQIRDARKVCRDLLIRVDGWGIGHCARSIMTWLDVPRHGRGGIQSLLEGHHQYYDAVPGSYPYAYMFDIQSCHWSLFSRLPGLRCYYHHDRLRFVANPPDLQDRYLDLCEVAAQAKVLRNTLVGAMLADGPITAYSKGNPITFSKGRSNLYSVAALIVRSKWELARDASEEAKSVCTCSDSVVTEQSTAPPVWRRHGLASVAKAHGPALVVSPWVFRCGNQSCKNLLYPGVPVQGIPLQPKAQPALVNAWM